MTDETQPLLRIQVPLKVVLLTEGASNEHPRIRSAISRAFQGGQASAEHGEAYFSVGEDLGVAVLEAHFDRGEQAARQIVMGARASALHTLLVLLLYDMPSPAFQAWLDELDPESGGGDEAKPALSLLPIAVREAPWSGSTQALQFAQLGEYALRVGHAAAHVLAWAWRMLGPGGDRMCLFISHAKLDGLPLARSFKHQLEHFHGLEHFYDAQDIPPGANWKRILHLGVQKSVVVALRTNVYEERFWCVQELDWAEDHGCPLVLVDARTLLVRARETLPVGGCPCVQVPDGNLLRVLHAALREALRVRLFLRQIEALTETGELSQAEFIAVPRTSLATLGTRCEAAAKAGKAPRFVFVPEPFRETHRPIVARLVEAYFPAAWFGTPREWIDQHLAQASGGTV